MSHGSQPPVPQLRRIQQPLLDSLHSQAQTHTQTHTQVKPTWQITDTVTEPYTPALQKPHRTVYDRSEKHAETLINHLSLSTQGHPVHCDSHAQAFSMFFANYLELDLGTSGPNLLLVLITFIGSVNSTAPCFTTTKKSNWEEPTFYSWEETDP